MNYLGYLLFLLLAYPLSYLPFGLLYRLSDVAAFFLGSVIGYRRKVIDENLALAFPRKSEEERNGIRKKFYQNLADIILESFKSLSISPEEIIERYRMVDHDFINKYARQGQSVIVAGPHFSNWEWGVISGGLQIDHKAVGIYKELSNQKIDAHLEGIRKKFGMNLYDLKETSKAFEENHDQNAAFLMLSDQSPHQLDKAHWVQFLGIETACIHGPESYARRYQLPVIFVDIERRSRGRYIFRPIELCSDPESLESGKITELFMQQLERSILKAPHCWLWSHRRWKHRKNAG